MTKQREYFVPVFVALGVVLGILIGSFFGSRTAGGRVRVTKSSSNKIDDLFHLIDDQYVDTVNISDLVERSMPQILKQLDPHSTYISAADAAASMQDLKGSFFGIGVQFTIVDDTVRIIRIIKGGPSEQTALRPGDRIVSVDGQPYTGKEVTNEETLRRLKGEEKTQVTVGVLHSGARMPENITITRGAVKVNSVTAAYLASDSIGYIRLSTFGDNTKAEFDAALAKLNFEGFNSLIIDLRGNLGGYMEPAVMIANEFLARGDLIVYTEGRKSPRQDYRADGRGSYQNLPLVLLVDETSASASEILAGAIQDNDRGTIVGRRSFGKGLVQVPVQFDDGSMLRLTKARYYTPSGRCVQKPYTPGQEDEYEADLILRASTGEYYNADSIKATGEKYKTALGRTVYGGGGITPDVFIAQDTAGMTSYFKEAYMRGLIAQYGYRFADNNRQQLTSMNNIDQIAAFVNSSHLLDDFANFAEAGGLKRRNLLLQQSGLLFREFITTRVIDDILDEEAGIRYANRTDHCVLNAIDILRRHASRPLPPGSVRKDIIAWSATGPTALRLHGAHISLLPPSLSPITVNLLYAICPTQTKRNSARKYEA